MSELLCDDEVSIGDYVLSGGELGAAVIVDAVVRLLPGVLGNPDSAKYESFGAEERADGAKVMACRGRPTAVAGCWIIRTTRGRRSFVECGSGAAERRRS